MSSEQVDVAAGGVEGCDGEQKSGEGVEAQGIEQVAVEERGESSGGTAAGAIEVEVLVDGTLRIEVVLRGWEEGQERDREDDGCGRCC